MRVLVIDDDPTLLSLMELMLSHIGLSDTLLARDGPSGEALALSRRPEVILLARDGPSGEALALAHRPEVILLDVLMPDQDGWETLRALRKGGYTGRILMFTALDTAALHSRARLGGANGVLQKPLTRAALAAALGVEVW